MNSFKNTELMISELVEFINKEVIDNKLSLDISKKVMSVKLTDMLYPSNRLDVSVANMFRQILVLEIMDIQNIMVRICENRHMDIICFIRYCMMSVFVEFNAKKYIEINRLLPILDYVVPLHDNIHQNKSVKEMNRFIKNVTGLEVTPISLAMFVPTEEKVAYEDNDIIKMAHVIRICRQANSRFTLYSTSYLNVYCNKIEPIFDTIIDTIDFYSLHYGIIRELLYGGNIYSSLSFDSDGESQFDIFERVRLKDPKLYGIVMIIYDYIQYTLSFNSVPSMTEMSDEDAYSVIERMFIDILSKDIHNYVISTYNKIVKTVVGNHPDESLTTTFRYADIVSEYLLSKSLYLDSMYTGDTNGI